MPVRVLIVDDSALVRQLLTEMLDGDSDIEVVGAARDPFEAREKIKKLNPDVLTLDVEMPRMDGVTFLTNLMRLRPMPVVMVSSLTEKGADVTLRALELGAVDFVSKPKFDLAHGLPEYTEELRGKIKQAAGVKVRQLRNDPRLLITPKHSADVVLEGTSTNSHFHTTDKIIAIGASTGGTEAIRSVLSALPAASPGIVVSQHIPAAFSGPFAKRVDSYCAISVQEAKDGQQILPGHAYIAPGNRHLLIERSGARYICRLNDGPPVNRHIPSVDVLFRSMAQNAGPNGIGILLTGMGDDGARGLLEMLQSGASTIVQDQQTSVVWGMPGEAARLGAAEEIVPLDKIAGLLLRQASKKADIQRV
jgi:two-component system chemotaxis response regulator CheB